MSYRSWISTKDMTDHHILCSKIFEIMSHNLGDFCLKNQKIKQKWPGEGTHGIFAPR